MSRTDVILNWIWEQIEAKTIKPKEGERLARLVNMTGATDEALFISFCIYDAAHTHRRGRPNVISKNYSNRDFIRPEYDAEKATRTISFILQREIQTVRSMALCIIALINAGVINNDIERKAIHAFVKNIVPHEKAAKWNNTKSFTDAMQYAAYIIDKKTSADILYKFNRLYNLM